MFKRYFFIKWNTFCFSKHQIYWTISEKGMTGSPLVSRGYINTLLIYYSSNNIAKRSKMKDQYASMQQAIEYNNMKT